MVLASRVIPILLYRGEELVKGQRFDSWRGVGSAIQAMRIYDRRKVDELIFLDVGATREGRSPDLKLVAEVADEFSCPLTVGGGVRTLEDVRQLLRSGADKVAVGTAVDLVPDIARTFGSQCAVVSVDHDGAQVYVRSGLIPVKANPVNWAKQVCDNGAGELLLNSIHRDGTMQGYDLTIIKQVCAAVDVPVIACGGCSGYEDMAKALDAGAAAVAAGALFQFTEATPKGAVQYLKEHGYHVRVQQKI